MGLASLLVWLGVPGVSHAVPGDPDPTFGTAGIVTTFFGGPENFCTGVAVQPDGKIITTGGGTAIERDHVFARYNEDGTPDVSFNGSGTRVVDISPAFTDESRAGLLLQPDGKIVTGGLVANGFIALVRLDANGSLDSTFNGSGIVTTNMGESSAIQGIALQPDGKIVVTGPLSTSGDFVVGRYQSNGVLDPSFAGGSGIVTFVGGGTQRTSGVAVQSDGRIVVAGTSDGDFLLTRVETNGSLDTSFGTSGFMIHDIGATDDEIGDLLLQDDGKLVAVGVSGGDAVVARYDSDGSLDPSFGSGGIVIADFGGTDDVLSSVRLTAKGRIVAAGHSAGDFALLRLNADGTFDTSFGDNGLKTFDVGGSDTAESVAIDGDGRVVACGGGQEFRVARVEGTFCETSPRSGCLIADKSLLLIKDKPEDDKDKLLFKWLNGTVSLPQFGNPESATHYALCVYDQNGVVLETAVLPGGTCDGSPCWKATGNTGVQYKDKSRASDGMQIIKLKSGTGKAKLLLKGKGENLPDPSLPLTPPVTAQVVTSDEATCWGAVFLESDQKKNSTGQYKAK